ncbi:MAG: permease [Bacteroides sp.]|nr:permease [Bacteroides sp.]
MQTDIFTFLNLLNEMSPYLLLGFLVAGILHAFVPQQIYTRHLSKNNFRSVLMAALFGIPLPLCSCGVIPTAMSLRKNGASRGATVAFLISTPQTGVDSILATWSLMGAPFAIIRPFVAFITSLFGGTLVNQFCKNDINVGEEVLRTEAKPKNFIQRCMQALRYGYVDMMQDIGKWLVLGLVIAGLITLLLPDDFFTAFRNYPILNMLIVLAFAVPMYLCATESIPIAVALMLKGLTPGAALVLLMAGPATSMASILVVSKVLKRKVLFLYLLTIIGGAILFGLGIDYLLPTEWFTQGVIEQGHHAGCHTHETAWWKWASSILLLLLLLNAYLRKGKKYEHTKGKRTFKIKGMNCNHCVNNVQRNLAQLESVKSVQVDLTTETAYIEGDVSNEEVISTIERLGFEVIKEA